MYFLLPLYVLSIVLMKFASKLFVGLAFDSGGVTGGALTSAFLTPFTLGVAQAVAEGSGPGAQSILINRFCIIAFITVTPLIAVQILGIIYDIRMRKIQQIPLEDELTELKHLITADDTDDDKDNGSDHVNDDKDNGSNDDQNTFVEAK